LSKLLFEVASALSIVIDSGRNPGKYEEHYADTRLKAMMQDTTATLEACSMDLDAANGEPGTCHPWSTEVYGRKLHCTADIVSRLTTMVNFYTWLGKNYPIDKLLVNPSEAMFGAQRVDQVVIWCRDLATCLENEQGVIPASADMYEMVKKVVVDGRQFRDALRSVAPKDAVTQDIVNNLSPELLTMRVTISTLSSMVAAMLCCNLAEIETDVIGLYSTRGIFAPQHVKID
jgi:hypothetical protein